MSYAFDTSKQSVGIAYCKYPRQYIPMDVTDGLTGVTEQCERKYRLVFSWASEHMWIWAYEEKKTNTGMFGRGGVIQRGRENNEHMWLCLPRQHRHPLSAFKWGPMLPLLSSPAGTFQLGEAVQTLLLPDCGGWEVGFMLSAGQPFLTQTLTLWLSKAYWNGGGNSSFNECHESLHSPVQGISHPTCRYFWRIREG